jgi:hypothetical protein
MAVLMIIVKGPFSRPILQARELLKQGMNYRASVVRREKCFRTAEKFLAISGQEEIASPCLAVLLLSCSAFI